MNIVSAMSAADFVALAAAFLAFGTSIWSNKIARDALKAAGKQKVAEFCREWIETLRREIADFNASVYRKKIAQQQLDNAKKLDKAKKGDRAKTEKWYQKVSHCTEDAGRHYEYVLLCLNREEADHSELEERMKSVMNGKSNEQRKPPTVTDLARPILKKEWDRLSFELGTKKEKD